MKGHRKGRSDWAGLSPEAVPPALLAAYVDGEVTPSEAAAVERALEASPLARQHVRELQDLRGLMASVPPELEGIDLVDRVRAAVESQKQARASLPRTSRRWLGAGLGSALAACAALLLVVVRRPHPSSRIGVNEVEGDSARSEEHTSELQSPMYLVCRLLLEK